MGSAQSMEKAFILLVFSIGVALFIMGIRIYLDARDDQKELKEYTKWVWMIGLFITLLGMIGIIALFVSPENKMPVLLFMMGAGLFGIGVSMRTQLNKKGVEEAFSNIIWMVGVLFVVTGVIFKVKKIPVKLYTILMILLGGGLATLGGLIGKKIDDNNPSIFKDYSKAILWGGAIIAFLGIVVLITDITDKHPKVEEKEKELKVIEKKVEQAEKKKAPAKEIKKLKDREEEKRLELDKATEEAGDLFILNDVPAAKEGEKCKDDRDCRIGLKCEDKDPLGVGGKCKKPRGLFED